MLDINNNNITGSWVIWTYFNQITYSQAFEDYYNYAFYITWEYQTFTTNMSRRNFDSSNNEID